jgi:hypothetical protein
MAFPGNNYAPPAPYSRTQFENPIQGGLDTIKIPVFIGEGNEFLVQRNLEVVRGSSATIDQRKVKEDTSGRAVAAISGTGEITLGNWDGVLTRLQVRDLPLVNGSGNGTITNSRSDVSATINGLPIVVLSVDGANGIVELAQAPLATDDVRITYFFNRTDTLVTDDLSDQVSVDTALILAISGISDVNAQDAGTEVVALRADVLDGDGNVVTPGNNVLIATVDGTEYSVELTAGSYTVQQVSNLISSAPLGSLVGGTFINHFGKSALSLSADNDITIGSGSANQDLGLLSGATTSRRKTFYAFQGPLVDGTNGGVTTTDPSHVTVKVDGVQVIPTSVDGSTRAITLPQAPATGATVAATYWFNSWENTFDYLAHNSVVEVNALGEVPDGTGFNQGADFILKDDKILWGTAWTVEADNTSAGSELFDDTQVSGTLVDDKTFLSTCSSVVQASGGSAVESKKLFQLPFDPTLGNGRNTPLGASLFQTVSNGRIDQPVNRPDVVDAYWGYGVQDALDRGAVTVTKVEGNIIELAAEVPTGATVYASFYYNSLTDNEYTLTASLIGASGTGQYTIEDEAGSPVRNVGFSTGDKGSALLGVSVEWPSGSELSPDARFEGVGGDLFTGPVDEIVTVQFESKDATPARFAVPGASPYEFITSQSDRVRIRLDNTELNAGVSGIPLTNPTTHSGGAPANLVGEQIDYDGGTGATIGQSYSLAANEDLVLYIDGVEVPVTIPAQNASTASDLIESVNEAANGVQLSSDAGGSATTFLIPVTVPGSGINGYFENWEVVVGDVSGIPAMAAGAGDVRTITSYVSATRTATVAAWSGAASDVGGGSGMRVYNPESMAQYKGATRVNGPVDLTAFSDILFTYVGDVSGTYTPGAAISLGAGPYASAADLAPAIEAALNGAAGWTAAGAAFDGAGCVVTADADGRMVLKVRAAGDDTQAYFTLINAAIADADNLALLLGWSAGAAVASGQAHLVCAGDVAKVLSVVGASGALYDNVALRNRLVPSSGLLSIADGEQIELRVGAGSALDRFGFAAGDFGAGGSALVTPATLRGEIGFSGGQDVATSQPEVTFYDGTGVQAANDELVLTLDGISITVQFTSSAAGTATDLGPASGTGNGSVLDQVIDAIAGATTLFGANAAAVFANGIVYQVGAGIEISSATSQVTSLVEITGGSSAGVLGFTEGDLAQRDIPSVQALASALNENRHATFGTWILDFTAVNPNPNEMFASLGLARVAEDSAGNDFLFLQSLSLGTSSIVELRDPTVAAVVNQSWLFPGTGVDAVDLDGAVGEAGLDGFFVSSNQPTGSGSAADSVLNNGTGSDGVVGQTYRDAVTGLTFTVLPRGWQSNPTGPWVAYPTGANATFRFGISRTVSTDANLPILALKGLEMKVANTLGMAVGDTALVSTHERGGNEPLNGDVYYTTYTYSKDDFSTAFYTKVASIEAAYGEIHPDNPVTLASFLATLNGAVLVGIKQVQREEGSNYASIESYRDAITDLEGVLPGQVTPDIITPLRGDSTELYQILSRSNSIQSSIRYRSERTSIIGMSAGRTPKDAGDLAQLLNSDRMRLVYPSMAIVQLTDAFNTTKEHLVDGPMLAAALAGSVVSPNVDVAVPWTGRRLVGFSQLATRLDAVQMNQVAQKGVILMEERPPYLRVRHGLTTDMSNVLTKVPTVRMISDEVQRQSRAVLERFIGIKFLPGILTQIEGRLAMMLKQMVKQQIISAYTGVKANVAADDPTVAEVEAFYSPVFPLLYIVLTFHLRASL